MMSCRVAKNMTSNRLSEEVKLNKDGNDGGDDIIMLIYGGIEENEHSKKKKIEVHSP